MTIKNRALLRKLILFFVSFCAYITIEMCIRGYSYPLMGLVAGMTFLFVDELNNELLSWDTDILLQGCVGAAAITYSELVAGTLWKSYGVNPLWDYDNIILNYQGVICLPFGIVWIILSIIGIMLADSINYYILKIEYAPYYILFGKEIIRFK